MLTRATFAAAGLGVVAASLVVGVASAAVGMWEQRQQVSGLARRAHAAVYDGNRQRVILFGGRAGSTKHGDTWEWTGSGWNLLLTTGPSARDHTAMAFDEVRRVVVLFGGRGTDNNGRQDTWLYDGIAWRQVSTPVTPAIRYGHAMAFDGDANRVVLFGGIGAAGNSLADFWEWNGTTWLSVSLAAGTPRPTQRTAHGMTWDPLRHRLVLYGGTGVNFLDVKRDLWEFARTTSTWVRQCDPCPPGLRTGHAMTYDASPSRTVFFGGLAPAAQDDVRAWDGTSWSAHLLAPKPSPRTDATFVYDPRRRRAVLFGGAGQAGELGDTWEHYTRGQPCANDAECATGFCRDGVCCADACAGKCRRCDVGKAIPVIETAETPGGNVLTSGDAVILQDGICRNLVHRDPDRECSADAQACTGTCAGGRCVRPNADTSCAPCAVCGEAGRCDRMPASGTDPACPLILCSAANTPCRTYHDARACAAVGRCAAPMEWPACVFTEKSEGTPCLPNKWCTGSACIR